MLCTCGVGEKIAPQRPDASHEKIEHGAPKNQRKTGFSLWFSVFYPAVPNVIFAALFIAAKKSALRLAFGARSVHYRYKHLTNKNINRNKRPVWF
jgi:hypothetical protein